MTHAILVNATDLERWANRRDAQEMLPSVIRRLVHATRDRVVRAGFRAGEGIQLGGWDGIVEAERGNAFVPEGRSVWEIGVGKNVKAKADGDYENRMSEPIGETLSQSTFVFVTPRRWAAKQKWVNDRRRDRHWRDVRAYDADDLEQWVETAPAVHIWLSILTGKRPQGAEDLSTFWDNWSEVTNPTMSSDLVLAGRQIVVDAIHKWLEDPKRPMVLRGESRAEAIAVFAAAVQKLAAATREEILSCAVLVRDLSSWSSLSVSGAGLVLIGDLPDDSATIWSAVRNGHSVILLSGRSDASSDAVEIPRLSSELVEKILVGNGVAEHTARDLAALARRSQTAFRRKIAVVPEIEQPRWARPENSRSLLPALLAGRWAGDMEGDQRVLATLAGKNFREVSSELVRWSNEDDPPVRCVGTTWYLTSEEDAWELLGRFLTQNDLDRFQRIAVELLGRVEPAFDLPDDERWTAAVIGPRAEHSGVLRTGIANTLAILGARGNGIRTTGGSTLETFARRPVAQLLNTSDWKVWASLPLNLLAEAAPNEFLSSVERGVSHERPFLVDLFRDKDAEIFTSSPHIGLLFALESLAWNGEYLVRTVTLLAKLARLDPGGKYANRPLNSLRSILLLWFPQTTASLENRFVAIDTIRTMEPEIAWKVMTSLLPRHRDHSSPNPRPRWREWPPVEDVRVTGIEYANSINGLVARALEDVGTGGKRWSDLIDALLELPPNHYGAVVARLETLDPRQFASNDRASLCNALRTLISRHRSYADADWALPKNELGRLETILLNFEPREPLLRYGWLFGNNASFPEGREDDWTAYQQAIAVRQCKVIKALYETMDLSWLSEFIENVARPSELGAAFARSDIPENVEDDLIRAYLCPDVRHRRAFLAGFINTRVLMTGIEWAKNKLTSMHTAWSAAQRAAFCVCLPFNAATWEFVAGMDQATISIYWTTVTHFYVPANEIETVTRQLLQHGRPSIAADLIRHHVRGSKVPVDLVLEVLESLLQNTKRNMGDRPLLVHDLSDLLSYVSSSDDVDENRIAKLEWAFLPFVGRHDHNPKILIRELARKPEFFAQVIRLAYRAEGEEPKELSEDEKARAERAYELLQSWRWRPLPGMPEDGVLAGNALRGWVLDARKILRSDGRLASGDYTVGQVLSGSPSGDDAAWPHPAVRDLVEELASDDFEQGLIVGLLNSEGVSCRNPNEGGTRERQTAERYQRFADSVAGRWPRTAAMLRRVRDHYVNCANQEDRRAELREDLLT